MKMALARIGFGIVEDVAFVCSLKTKPFVLPISKTIHFNTKKNYTLVVFSSFNSDSAPKPGFGLTHFQNKEGNGGSSRKELNVLPETDSGNGNNGNENGNFNGGSGGGGENGGDDEEEDEFGPILKYEEVMREIEARGTTLPSDMLEAAKTIGIRKLLLIRYLDLQGSAWPLGFVMKSCAMIRNRMLADPSFLFKIGTEIVIDTCCATLAEYQQRGKDFWAEFELYLADMLVGVVVNVALVGMLAPYARIGQPSFSKSFLGRVQQSYGALPSSVFEAERPGCRFSAKQRIATYFFKGVMYGSVGFGCGLIGQGIANLIMTAKRSMNKSEEDVPVPPLVKSAALWGVFLAISSNTRYQIINGLERLVEASPMAKQAPPMAMAFTIGVRFANNVYGGMQFVDWARLSGGKAIVKETDMPEAMQKHVMELAYQALDLYEVSDFQSIAHYIKQRFDEAYGPSWHCVVGIDFGSCITHLSGSFIFFWVEMMEFLIFKDGKDFKETKVEAIGYEQT